MIVTKLATAGAIALALVSAPHTTPAHTAAPIKHTATVVKHVAPVRTCTEVDGSGKQAFPCWSEEGFTINSTHKACVYNARTEVDGDSYWNGTKGVWFTHTYPNGKVVKTCAL